MEESSQESPSTWRPSGAVWIAPLDAEGLTINPSFIAQGELSVQSACHSPSESGSPKVREGLLLVHHVPSQPHAARSFPIFSEESWAPVGEDLLLIRPPSGKMHPTAPHFVKFRNPSDCATLIDLLRSSLAKKALSPSAKADESAEGLKHLDTSTVTSYFSYYGKLSNQMNMLQDSVRTSSYHDAITGNPSDFKGAVVMDVGAGSGILSFFAAQAGAAKVIAVEASKVSEVARRLAQANGFENTIHVVNQPLENLPNNLYKVDCLISEPIGTFLFNERMIETYLDARDKYLKPGGAMFPNRASLFLCPFSDAALFADAQSRCRFWENSSFFGVDLSAATDFSRSEHFKQPVVDYIDPNALIYPPVQFDYDFVTIQKSSLLQQNLPFQFPISQPCLIHGIAGWFDIFFDGKDKTVAFSTAPWSPPTHWYQIRFLLRTPLAVNPGQVVEGCLSMEVNPQQSYNIDLTMRIQGTSIEVSSHDIDLKDPDYRYFSSSNTYYPSNNQQTQSAPSNLQAQAASTTAQTANQNTAMESAESLPSQGFSIAAQKVQHLSSDAQQQPNGVAR